MDISSSKSLCLNKASIVLFFTPMSLFVALSLTPIFFLLLVLINHLISLYISFLFIHSQSNSITFAFNSNLVYLLNLPPSPLIRPYSPLVLHLPSSLAHLHCHWSVLASLSFSYQTELIWLPYQGWVQTGAGQIRKGGEAPAPLLLALLAYVGPSRWRAVGQMRITKNKGSKMTAASNNS